MSYEVLARKWRPQQFEHVVGQEHVTRTLGNAIEADRLAHAYLFVGPRGIGKTSVARIFAKALNCTQGPTTTPCDKCDSCKEIALGSSLDVLEIDGASNNGVDQVRELRETVKFAPTRGKFKIYIIDEVHMLTTAAFNALLKTLEEPPAHVKFLFATTEPEKVLATIVSRCQRFDLRRIPVGEIIERLRLIAKSEKVTIDDDALLAIARGSEGALRDAESALDQLISFKGTKIEEADVLSVFGLVARETLEQLAGALLAGDVAALIERVADLDREGKDLRRLIVELLEHFRNLLICLHLDVLPDGMDITAAQERVLREQAGGTDAERLLRVIQILTETEDRMRYALSRRTLLETALIRCAHVAVVVSLEEVLARINELKAGTGGGGEGLPLGEAPAPPARVHEGPPPAAPEPVGATAEFAEELSRLLSSWRQIIDQVGRVAVIAKSLLVDARPVSVTAEAVVIAFDPEFAEELDELRGSVRAKKGLERAVARELGRAAVVEFVVSDGPLDLGNKAGGDGRGGKVAASVVKEGGGNWADDPTVQKTIELFDGEIVDIRE